MIEVDGKIQNVYNKLEKLKIYLKSLKSVAVAFSGGVDSAFLLKVAQEVLGDHVIAITARSCAFPKREFEETKTFCRNQKIRQYICDFDILNVSDFCENPPNRCYLCKKELFSRIIKIAKEQHVSNIIEGSNMDDNKDYRPGIIAISELGIDSPLQKAEFYKEEIRKLSKEMRLPTWKKPSFACLSSRFAYGEHITEEKLAMVEQAEQLLLDKGFQQIRVRIHSKMARIEVMPEELEKLVEKEIRTEIISKFKSYGFTYVSMDLEGYRTGSMHETL